MNTEKKDLSKQQRRKRKDPESRDFKCKCGKSYLSYAAVYTHVKNKHNGEKDFQDSIIKPEKEKLKRGRPRDKKKIVITSETQILSICEETTLLIYDHLKEHKDKFYHHIILEGNEQMNQQTFQKEYERLNEKKGLNVNLLLGEGRVEQQQKSDEDESKIFMKFLKGVIKHFTAEIAARVSFVVNYLAEVYEQVNFEDRREMGTYFKELNELELWMGEDEINLIIYEAMIRWLGILRKQQAEE